MSDDIKILRILNQVGVEEICIGWQKGVLVFSLICCYCCVRGGFRISMLVASGGSWIGKGK